MPTLLLLAPVFLIFEVWQLAMGERYLGIKQIARGADPREMGPGEWVAFFWSSSLVAYAVWMASLLFIPEGRVHGLCLIAVTTAGLAVRRNCGIKWILVTMTFEGATRIGFLFYLSAMLWRRS